MNDDQKTGVAAVAPAEGERDEFWEYLLASWAVTGEASQYLSRSLNVPEDRRIDRASYCGRTMYKTKADGNLGRFTFVCGTWDYCPHCMERRAGTFRERAEKAIDQVGAEKLIVAFVDEKTARRLARKADKTSYFRAPQDDGMVFIIGNRNDPAFAELESEISVDNVDWIQVAKTPRGKRYSGALGREMLVATESTDDDPVITMNVRQVIVETPEGANRAEIIDESWLDACAETIEERPPFDANYLEASRELRMTVFIQALKRRGAKIVLTTYAKERLSFSQYRSWKPYELNNDLVIERIAAAAGIVLNETNIPILKICYGLA